MRIALISDIHANLAALEAVLADIRHHHPQRIISLGDQVNLGPCPRETLALLKSEGVTCLHGNHERYILRAMAGDPAYSGANFHMLRFNARLLSPQDITFPETLRLSDSILCTHAMPGDDRFPVYDPQAAYPRLREMNDGLDRPLHILCGHGHNPTYYAFSNLTVHCIGSVGCMDEAAPGIAPYTIAEIDGDGMSLRPYYVAYDTGRLPALFLSSGLKAHCPIMARIGLTQMMNNCDLIIDFVAGAQKLSAARGEAVISQDTWEEANRRFAWPDGLTTAQFWKQYGG
ncbi:MAG: metallophosphoesterase [Clostridia bacterium]|nr:metallophosphoesterase [Clostridia bacterium]